MKKESKKRQARLEVRLSEKEKEYVQHKAEIASKSISDYIRSVAITGIVINSDTSKAVKVLTALDRIGNNINQITRAVHIHGDYVSKDDIKSIREEFEAIKNIIIDKIVNASFEYQARLNEVRDKLVDVYVDPYDLYDEDEELAVMDMTANDLAEFGIEFPNRDEEEITLESPDDFMELLKKKFGD